MTNNIQTQKDFLRTMCIDSLYSLSQDLLDCELYATTGAEYNRIEKESDLVCAEIDKRERKNKLFG
jgi:hypothetical protein